MTTIELFKELCKIPHCSCNAQAMLTHLCDFAKKYEYDVQVDNANNILCTKRDSLLTLQAHYDMVCIGEYEHQELYESVQESKTWLKAKNSTLGADNGIGIALILKAMSEGKKIDALFTSDEEIGLIGARELALEVLTPYLLNIDSEEEAVVTLGCAGGVDVNVNIPLIKECKRGSTCKQEKSGYKGGHSGVDIHLNIENAIKELASELTLPLVSIEGGERRNSIAKKAEATLYVNEGDEEIEVIKNSSSIIEALQEFEHGVRAFNEKLNIVQSSVNLAMIHTHESHIQIHLSLRSMDDAELKALLANVEGFFKEKILNATVSNEGYYTPWTPQENDFTQLVVKANEAVFDKVSLGAIHAGLECGILGEKMPNLQMASIGPNIVFPHSTREAVELESVVHVEKVLNNIINLCEEKQC